MSERKYATARGTQSAGLIAIADLSSRLQMLKKILCRTHSRFISITIIIQFLLSAISTSVYAQDAEPIIAGKKISIYSNILREDRKVWIYMPHDATLTSEAEKRYPVLYLLDGDAHFFSTVGIIQQLSQANGNAVLPQMIIVAIENTNRMRDFVPYLSTHTDKKTVNPFLTFLSNELIPFVDDNYKVAPYKLIAGHSLGGLTVVDILATNPTLFNAYLAIDPSMWYNNEQYLFNSIASLPKQNLINRRLFIGIANTLPKGLTFSKIEKTVSPETQHLRSILKLDKFLKTNKNNGLLYASKYYQNDNHNSVPLISEYDGLRFIFDYFAMEAYPKDLQDSTTSLPNKIKSHYQNISRQIGYKIPPDQAVINYLAYHAVTEKHYAKAEAFLKMNVENFPNSHKVFDALGDYYIAIKDTANAAEAYTKALTLQENVATKTKLNRLKAEVLLSLAESDLKQYTGEYVLEKFEISVFLEIRNGKLYAITKGQSDSEFVPVARHVFTVKDKPGYTISFEMGDNKPISFTSVQPNGIFKGILK